MRVTSSQIPVPKSKLGNNKKKAPKLPRIAENFDEGGKKAGNLKNTEHQH